MESATLALKELKTSVSEIKGHRDFLNQQHAKIKHEVKILKEEESIYSHVEALFRKLIDLEISEAVDSVVELQTEALRSVFTDQHLSVKADVTTSRGKVAVNLITVQLDDDGEVLNEGVCHTSFGGSVTTVESMLLRFFILLKRGLRPFLLLDEALPAFDPKYATNMGQFLKKICERMGVDILMVTHNPMLFESANKAYRIKKTTKGISFDLVSS